MGKRDLLMRRELHGAGGTAACGFADQTALDSERAFFRESASGKRALLERVHLVRRVVAVAVDVADVELLQQRRTLPAVVRGEKRGLNRRDAAIGPPDVAALVVPAVEIRVSLVVVDVARRRVTPWRAIEAPA